MKASPEEREKFLDGFFVRNMEQDKLIAINRCIQSAAQPAAEIGGLSVSAIERFVFGDN